jgi:hypothetical protein
MNLKNVFASVVMGMIFSGAALAAVPAEVMLPVDDVYSPKGFDSNDNAQIVISGYLPNLCHRTPKAIVSVKDNKVDIKMVSLKYDLSNPHCLEMIVPFVEAVDLGVLDKGAYDIVVNGKSIFESRANLYVQEAQSDAVDEHVYAAVEYIDRQLGSKRVVLKGYNPSDCFVLDDIEILDNEKNVYSILPKMKQISSHCPMKMMPFEYEVQVPSRLKAQKVLLHVRSIEGRSVNSIMNNSL